LKFVAVLRKSFVNYRANLVLLLPPVIINLVTFVVLGYYFLPFVLNSMRTPSDISQLGAMLGATVASEILLAVLGLIGLVGQTFMTAKVVMEGKTRLGDWWVGLRRYFWRILGVSAVYFGVVIGVSFIGVFAYIFLVVVPAVVTNPTAFQPTPVPQFGSQPIFLLGTTVLSSVGWLVFYTLLAPTVIGDKRVGASIVLGLGAVRKSGRTFLAFLLLFLALSLIQTTISLGGLSIPNLLSNPSFMSLSTPTHLLSAGLSTVLSPLWFLIAFRMYSEADSALTASVPARSSETNRRICTSCGTSIPSEAKFCTNCGVKQ